MSSPGGCADHGLLSPRQGGRAGWPEVRSRSPPLCLPYLRQVGGEAQDSEGPGDVFGASEAMGSPSAETEVHLPAAIRAGPTPGPVPSALQCHLGLLHCCTVGEVWFPIYRQVIRLRGRPGLKAGVLDNKSHSLPVSTAFPATATRLCDLGPHYL